MLFPRFCILVFSIAFLPTIGVAEDAKWLSKTWVTSVSDQIPKAAKIRELEGFGYELAGGEYQSFKNWYRSETPAISVEGLTQIRSNLGINWGVSSGEFGEKYVIDPALKLGFTYVEQLSKDTDFSFAAYRFFGGGLREKKCIASYGELGASEPVNCRLAATLLAPKETLKYLIRDQDLDWGIRLSFATKF